MIKNINESNNLEINQGDLVDFGTYGKLYVCNPEFSDDYYWVTDNKSDRMNRRAQGWSILKDLADNVVEYADEDDDNDLDENNHPDIDVDIDDLEVNIDSDNNEEDDTDDILTEEEFDGKLYSDEIDEIWSSLEDSYKGSEITPEVLYDKTKELFPDNYEDVLDELFNTDNFEWYDADDANNWYEYMKDEYGYELPGLPFEKVSEELEPVTPDKDTDDVCPYCGSKDCDGSCQNKNESFIKLKEDVQNLYDSESAKYITKLYDKYVPDSGKADTVGGELVRALSQIIYRYLNDGDQLGVRYGRETVNPAARYIMKYGNNVLRFILKTSWSEDPFDSTISRSAYANKLEILMNKMAKFLKDNPDLFKKENPTDMWDMADPYEDVDDPEPEDEDDYWDDEDEEYYESCDCDDCNSEDEEECLDIKSEELDPSNVEYSEEIWKEIKSKSVLDSDGFLTDYTLYKNEDGTKFICMFGDKDIYEPDEAYADYETDSLENAKEWFNSYEGFVDEDEDY